MSGDSGTRLADAFTSQAGSCERLGSPFTARLCRLLAAGLRPGHPVADRCLAWPGDLTHTGANYPLRVTGALHALVLSGSAPALAAVYPPASVPDEALWRAVSEALAAHEPAVLRFLDSVPQTNEVARSAALISAAHFLDDRFHLPLVLSELGASAGLNLNWDRYAMTAAGNRWGPADAALTLSPEMHGALPPLAAPRVAQRRGADLNPIDTADPAQALRLRAYVWPDQAERFARMQSALALPPPPLDRADAEHWLEARLATRHPGALHLVYHTIAWTYFPRATQEACDRALAKAGAAATPDAPLAHLAMEADDRSPGAALTLDIWPGKESWTLGRFDFHGRWLDWNPARIA